MMLSPTVEQTSEPGGKHALRAVLPLPLSDAKDILTRSAHRPTIVKQKKPWKTAVQKVCSPCLNRMEDNATVGKCVFL